MRYSNPSKVSCVNQNTKPTKPRLSMVWVKQTDDSGYERLVAIWTTQD